MATRYDPLTWYLGVDPGKSGAMAIVDEDGDLIQTCRLNETQADVWAWLQGVAPRVAFAVLEKVHAMPRQGVASTFKFGESFGFCQGMLVAAGVPFELARPLKWQGVLDCRSKGDKNVTKSRAQQLFPHAKVIHATADAMLLAEFARRVHKREVV